MREVELIRDDEGILPMAKYLSLETTPTTLEVRESCRQDDRQDDVVWQGRSWIRVRAT
jgi:hypothetical protein